ncbi:MAG: 50S ribosomal protein L13 [Bdellovibrionales bacterium]
MKTFIAKEEAVEKKWWIVDATDKTLGRLATEIAVVLRGKNKAVFTPNVDTGDLVVVINSKKVKLTGKKMSDKIYYRHSRYFGGLHALTAAELLEREPADMILKAVQGMLPANKLSNKLLTHLKVYPGAEHPHKAQKPEALKV